MKIFLYILIGILGTSFSSVQADETLKSRVLQLSGGDTIISKVDSYIQRIGTSENTGTEYSDKIQSKIAAAKKKYTNSKETILILEYVEQELLGALAPKTNSGLLDRVKRAEYDAYKKRLELRKQKLQKLRYTRIPVKK